MSAPHKQLLLQGEDGVDAAVTVMVSGVNCSVGGGAAFGAAFSFAKVIIGRGPGSKLSTEACRRSPRERLEALAMTSAVARALW